VTDAPIEVDTRADRLASLAALALGALAAAAALLAR